MRRISISDEEFFGNLGKVKIKKILLFNLINSYLKLNHQQIGSIEPRFQDLPFKWKIKYYLNIILQTLLFAFDSCIDEEIIFIYIYDKMKKAALILIYLTIFFGFLWLFFWTRFILFYQVK